VIQLRVHEHAQRRQVGRDRGRLRQRERQRPAVEHDELHDLVQRLPVPGPERVRHGQGFAQHAVLLDRATVDEFEELHGRGDIALLADRTLTFIWASPNAQITCEECYSRFGLDARP
jgi:hypothetical protein